jgi:hypothetical protein
MLRLEDDRCTVFYAQSIHLVADVDGKYRSLTAIVPSANVFAIRYAGTVHELDH